MPGCCIGHHNHRYFMWLIFYLFLGTFYSSLFNHFFIWSVHGEHFRNWWTFLKLIFPLAMFAMDASIKQYYLLIYSINMVGGLFTGLLLFYHLRNLLHGHLSHGKTKLYDFGRIENIRIVFGERWYLTWLSPFVQSRLPHDGIEWQCATDGGDRTKHLWDLKCSTSFRNVRVLTLLLSHPCLEWHSFCSITPMYYWLKHSKHLHWLHKANCANRVHFPNWFIHISWENEDGTWRSIDSENLYEIILQSINSNC